MNFKRIFLYRIIYDKVSSTWKQNNLRFDWKVYHEDLHGILPLPEIKDELVYVFKWYQFKSPQKYNNPDTFIEEIQVLLNTQEIIYIKHFGTKTPSLIEELCNAYWIYEFADGIFRKLLL